MQTPASSRPPSLTISIVSEHPTNTLIIPNLPPAFFAPQVLEALKQHFATYGEIYAWTPLKGFKRILVVYYDDDDAEAARESDGVVIEHDGESVTAAPAADSLADHALPPFTLRVYRGDPMTFSRQPSTLRPPEIEHNYLISPPGSPPVGWEQLREEPPNTTTLAEDLARALEHLKLEREREGMAHEPHVLVSGVDGADGLRPTPRVIVQDADAEKAQQDEVTEWNLSLPTPRLENVRTAMPPVRGECAT
ncbi:Calcipressin [Dacryopinax primogenitus]|uniref:Calcipressin n=1 Tax=Dacryopinax primogenitus (strain DJM 731) TaxID=1858805 RepID=M5G6L1_DACPD|nr:Calcipressin [Dacryopinax primogenitus]EJU05891.1 Calcipressin [Dacryopinax primogenitus]